MTNQRYSHFFCGLGLGISAGVLLAPKTGAKTRALLAKTAREGRACIMQKTSEVYDATTSTIDHGKTAVKRTASDVAQAFEVGRRILVG